ncbi:MAG: antirestriction protein [Chloroflexota bacterium]|nr:antirestriction protein [Chloroflexota bacterium]
MASSPVMIHPGKVEAYPVSKHARMGTLPRHFGERMVTLEGRVFDLMRECCADYSGGYWRFYELSNGGFYMAPHLSRVRLYVPGNGYRGEMTGDAAGITVCLFALSHLSFEYRQAAVFARHFHWLREFALGHGEAGQIFRAID